MHIKIIDKQPTLLEGFSIIRYREDKDSIESLELPDAALEEDGDGGYKLTVVPITYDVDHIVVSYSRPIPGHSPIQGFLFLDKDCVEYVDPQTVPSTRSEVRAAFMQAFMYPAYKEEHVGDFLELVTVRDGTRISEVLAETTCRLMEGKTLMEIVAETSYTRYEIEVALTWSTISSTGVAFA